jgi:hypothetical protein
MEDGTYYVRSDGTFYDYAERWGYGAIVGGIDEPTVIGPKTVWSSELNRYWAIRNAVRDSRNFEFRSGLVGVWTDSQGFTHIERVQHVDTRAEALRLASARHESAIYDLLTEQVIYL